MKTEIAAPPPAPPLTSASHRPASAPAATDAEAIALLHDLVATPSLSGSEQRATGLLVERMRALGFERARRDAAGNAIGELGAKDAERVIVLLGHIDTVPGALPVRIAERDGRRVLLGRGSVDAKGPLAAFAVAAARLGPRFARAHGLRLVVAGAVEEESATSRGARALLAHFDGHRAPVPAGCVIGEPSRAHRVTLGYKGRLLIELDARQPMRHTAGPDAGAGALACALWQRLLDHAAAWNTGRAAAFDQLQPSVRGLATSEGDGLEEQATAAFGVRLPLGFPAPAFVEDLAAWARDGAAPVAQLAPGNGVEPVPRGPLVALDGRWCDHQRAPGGARITLTLRSFEPAYCAPRGGPLERAFLGAIREATTHRGEPLRPAVVRKTGTSDLNVVAPVWRCPILAYGPGDSALDHTPDEHLDLAEYTLAIAVLEAGLRRFAASLPAR